MVSGLALLTVFVLFIIFVGLIAGITYLSYRTRDSGTVSVMASTPITSFTMSEGLYYPVKFGTDQTVTSSFSSTTNARKFNVSGSNGVAVTTLVYTASSATHLTGQLSSNVLLTADTTQINVVCAVGVTADTVGLTDPTVINSAILTLKAPSGTFSGYFSFTLPFTYQVQAGKTVAIVPMILSPQPNSSFSATSVNIFAIEN